ncbi:MAG: hypothetical protein Q8Q15_03200 [bacterium]|nr:hypothetical protein [bacterium]
MEQETTNTDTEKLNNTNLLGRLLNRPVFAWTEEQQTTFRQKIMTNSQREAVERVNTVSQDITLSPTKVIEKIRSKVDSWQTEKLLDHSKLKRQFVRLSDF